MARTQAEVTAFLDTLIGTIVINKPDRDYDGQCVTLIKALLEFLGAPNPYAARGNAKDVGDALIRQGLGKNGIGSKLTVVVNRDMGLIGGVRYGHIWADVTNVANYESNGNRALHTTKNTRPLSQGQQFINLDQWIGEGYKVMDEEDAKELYRLGLHREPESNAAVQANVGRKFSDAAKGVRRSSEWLTQNHFTAYFAQREKQLADANKALGDANSKLKAALDNDVADKKAIADAQKAAQVATDQLTNLDREYTKAKAEFDLAKAREEEATKTGNAFLRWLGNLLNGGK